VFEQGQVCVGGRAGAQPDPRLGDVRVRVEPPAFGAVAPAVAEQVLVEHQVCLDRGDVLDGEGPLTVRALDVRQVRSDVGDVRPIRTEDVVGGFRPVPRLRVVDRANSATGHLVRWRLDLRVGVARRRGAMVGPG